jgi:hypothetical protein
MAQAVERWLYVLKANLQRERVENVPDEFGG